MSLSWLNCLSKNNNPSLKYGYPTKTARSWSSAGALTDFKNASEQQHFAYNEGLPGKAWAAGHPIVLTKFEHSYLF